MEAPAQQSHYVDSPRPEVAPFLPTTSRSALDVGCASGGFGRTLRAHLGERARIVGVEAVAEQVERARTDHGFDEVIEGFFPEALDTSDERFDLITFNDVLEHVVDPWATLRRAHRHLAPGGRIVAALPNVQYAPVVVRLAMGRWEYTDAGILDRTHLRFFTRSSMVDLFSSTGYAVERCEGVNTVGGEWRTSGNVAKRVGGSFVPRLLGNARYLQFVVVARAAT